MTTSESSKSGNAHRSTVKKLQSAGSTPASQAPIAGVFGVGLSVPGSGVVTVGLIVGLGVGTGVGNALGLLVEVGVGADVTVGAAVGVVGWALGATVGDPVIG